MTSIRERLTAAELVFAQRMLPHFLAGKPAEDAARAVLDDDVRIFAAFSDQAHSYFVPVGHGSSHRTREAQGDVIASQISRDVYSHFRALATSAGAA